MKDALDAQDIPNSVSRDGLAITVPPEFTGRARIAGASAGGWMGSRFSMRSVGTSPQRERWTYQRAREGELARTINELDEVEWTASISTASSVPHFSAMNGRQRERHDQLLPGAALDKSQIRGVRGIVSGAVEGLKASDVVLVDHEGTLLAGGEDEEGGISGMPSVLNLRSAEERAARRDPRCPDPHSWVAQ